MITEQERIKRKMLNAVVMSYATAALDYTEHGDGLMVDEFTISDIRSDKLREIENECSEFLDCVLAQDCSPAASLGAEFWFNRNGHAVDFFAVGSEKERQACWKACKQFGPSNLIPVNDGLSLVSEYTAGVLNLMKKREQ